MLVSLLWYYRPDHAEDIPEEARPEGAPGAPIAPGSAGSAEREFKVPRRQLPYGAAPSEVLASKHRDTNSVACIEDKCFVLTWNEYCR